MSDILYETHWRGPIGALAGLLGTHPLNVLAGLIVLVLAGMALGSRLYNRRQHTYRWVTPALGAACMTGVSLVPLKSVTLPWLTVAMLVFLWFGVCSVILACRHALEVARRITFRPHYEPAIGLLGVHSFLWLAFATLALGAMGIMVGNISPGTLMGWYNSVFLVGLSMITLLVVQGVLMRRRITRNHDVATVAAAAPRELQPDRIDI